MGYGYDPEETTGQEHLDGTAPESGGQEYTDSAQKTDASDMSAYSGVSDDTSAYSSGSTGAADNAQNASDNTQDTFNSASDADQGAQPSRSRYEYQNYYNDRYRGDDSKQKYGYQPGVQQTPMPKKRDSAGKWIAVSALVVIFVCVCIGIGLIGVYSIRSANQLDSASVGVLEVAPDAGDDAKNQEDDGNHAATDSPERSEAGLIRRFIPDRGYNNGRRTGCCSIGNCTAAERICSCNGCNAGRRSGNAGVRFDYE